MTRQLLIAALSVLALSGAAYADDDAHAQCEKEHPGDKAAIEKCVEEHKK